MLSPSPARVFLVLAVLGYAAIAACAGGAPANSAAGDSLFAEVARVLRHPRCLNCHTVTDFPRVGDERRRHDQMVVRGEDNAGAPAARCATCHQPENQDLMRIPGAPHWHLAPLSMGWEGLDDHDLADALKDKSANGDRSLEDLYEHMERDPLVLWGWDPDPGRTPVSISHEDFLQALRAWIDAGAPTPPSGVTSTF